MLNNFSIIIPTYKREKEITTCLDSILSQTLKPNEIVIIDDSSLPPGIIDKYNQLFESANANLVYYKKNHKVEQKGTSTSRNIGMSLVKNKYAFILDDDLILENDFFYHIMGVWEKEGGDKNLIGVGGVISNNRKKHKLEYFYNKLFGIYSHHSWDINQVSFQIWDDKIDSQEKGYYVHGGVCSYDKFKVQELGFTVFGGGREALEDVDFCMRAKNNDNYFIIEPKAKAFHNHKSTGKENKIEQGKKETRNRKMIFKKNCSQTIKYRALFIWSSLGWILKQFLSGNINKGAGMIRGFFS